MDISLFAGCSFTAGTGFDLEKDEPGLWVNLLHKNNNFLNKTKLLNVALAARSNAGIFNDTVYNILHNNIKYAFVAWTSVIRYEISLGLEWYTTRAILGPRMKHKSHNLNFGTYPASYIQNINDRLSVLVHPHEEIVNLIKYVNCLTSLCELKKCKIFFINAVCDWDNDYFEKKLNIKPIDYTEYTKSLISIDTRDDEEIFKIYNKMHSEYNQFGGIQKNSWLNLYDSMLINMIDTNDDNVHPGIESNYKYYKQLSKLLESKLN